MASGPPRRPRPYARRAGRLGPILGIAVAWFAGAVGADAAPLFHKTIRINAGQVTGGPHTNFPFLFSTTDPAFRTTANGGAVTNANGWDIIFATTPACADSTMCGGNKLDHEIETYNATTGQLIAWVRLPSIDNGTVFYVHYSDSAVVASTENRPGVWNSGYKGVWHLKETPPATANDSTSNANNGTPEVSPVQAAGQIDGSLQFDGTSERDVNVPNSASLQFSSEVTASGWARTTSVDGQPRLIVAKWKAAGGNNIWLGKVDASNMAFGADGGGASTAYAPLPVVNDGAWHYVVGVCEAAGTMRIYLDGVQRGTATFTPPIATGNSELRIGRSPDVLLQDWDGGLDEVRVSNVARPAGWIATEYANQGSPATFYSMDTMKVRSGSYVGTGVDNYAIGVGFRPDLVIVKRDEATWWEVMRTSTMVGDVTKSVDTAGVALFAGGIKSLDPLGFTLGTNANVNAAGAPYFWVAFQAAPGEMKVGTYNGNGLDNTNLTGMGFQPDYMVVMSQAAGKPVQRSSTMAGDTSYDFDSTEIGPPANCIQALQADGFQVGTDASVNSGAVIYHYVAWKATAGKMAVGTYVGTGVDNRNVDVVGFMPEWVLVKRTGDGSPWVHRPAATGISTDYSLFSSNLVGSSGDIQTLRPLGFQAGFGPEALPDRTNENGVTYHYIAFGPHIEANKRSIGGAANYTAGTLAATRGSTVVTGTGTAWKTANRGRGDRLTFNSVDYMVDAVISDTRIILTTPVLGASGSYPYTLARQFTTLQAWEDCISAGAACPFFTVPSASLVADSRREIGVAYNDGVYTLAAPFIISGSTTDATHSITLTADPGNRHNGTAGTGVRINGNAAGNEVQVVDDNVTLEWLEIYNVKAPGTLAVVRIIGPAAHNVLLQNLLIHDFFDAVNQMTGIRLSGNVGKSVTVRNSAVWDGDSEGISGDEYGDTLLVENCSVDWMHDASATGIQTQLSAVTVNNTIVTNSGTSYKTNGGVMSGSNNTSSDATASTFFTSAQTGVAASALFVTPDVVAADLHLKSGAVAIDTGMDLTASYASPSLAIDIDGQKRPAGAAWDRGMDEFGATTAVTLQGLSASGADAAVDLAWTTSSELDNLGFNLYRSLSPDGPFERITPALIPGLGSSASGQSYAYRDAGLENGVAYFYELEDVDTTGGLERHGPVSAIPSAAGPGSGPAGDGGSGGSGSGSSGGDGGTPGGIASGTNRTAYGDPASVSLEVLERDGRHVLLLLSTGGFYASASGDGSVRVDIPGFDERSRPGEPGLPTRLAWVEAVAGKRARITAVQALDPLSFTGLRPATAGLPFVDVGVTGVVRPGRAPRREGAAFRRGSFPRAAARVLGTGFQQETKKAQIELAPLRFDPASSTLVLSRRLLVRVDFAGTEPGEIAYGGSRGRRPPEPRRSFASATELVVQQKGLYRVAFEDAYASSAAPVPVAELRLARAGRPVAFHLEPDSSVFAPGSVLYFLSDGAALNPYAREAAYQLSRGTGGLRMAVASAPPSGSPTPFFFQRLDVEQNKTYQSGLLDAPERWLWEPIVSPAAKTYGFSIDQLADTAEPAHLSVWLQGASDFEANPDHHVRLALNGVPVGEDTWDGKLPRTIEADVTPGVLVQGPNTLEIRNVGDTPAAYSMVFLDRFALRYPRPTSAASGVLEGRFSESGTVEAAALGPGSLLLDTTDAAPRWLRAATGSGGGLAFRAEAGRSYFAASSANVLRPEIRHPAASGLRGRQRVDYLVVAPRDFLTAAQPLLDLRRSQGLASKGVAIEDVYDEFGFGEASPDALKAFLAYAYHTWSRPGPRYVVLLGDATYDPKDYLHTGVQNRIPPFPVKTSYLWTASDAAYARQNGDDLLPDFAIGRLPAASVAEARVMVDKIVAFESSGRGLDGPAVLVADNADLGGDFERKADDLASTVLAGWEVDKLYLRDLGGATRDAVRSAFDRGPAIVSYIGHGGIAVWASENVWNDLDVASLGPQGQQPLLFTMNCLNGYFHFPNLNALAEQFVKAEGRGAIAAFSPSGLSIDEPAHLYHQALLSEILSGRHARLGDAVLAAQGAYVDSGALPELLGIYHLFGDPALRLR
jgi:hypothetical protein